MTYRMFERIAFSLVLMSALACATFIAYERNPGVGVAFYEGMKLLRSYEYPCAIAAPLSGAFELALPNAPVTR